MPFPAPNPGDWNEPKALTREEIAEIERKMREPQAVKMEEPQPAKIGQPPPTPDETAAPKEEGGAPGDPWKPIIETGVEQRVTFFFVVHDDRPIVSLPLAGPGAYEVSVTRRT